MIPIGIELYELPIDMKSYCVFLHCYMKYKYMAWILLKPLMYMANIAEFGYQSSPTAFLLQTLCPDHLDPIKTKPLLYLASLRNIVILCNCLTP